MTMSPVHALRAKALAIKKLLRIREDLLVIQMKTLLFDL